MTAVNLDYARKSEHAAVPRVLFVTSAAFNRITGGGITFSNLFRGWPSDCLAAVHNDPVPVSTDVCRSYYRLTARELTRWPRGFWAPSSSGQPAAVQAAAHSKTMPSFARSAKALFVGNTWPDTGVLSPELADWIDAFQPSVLYTILGTIGMMELIDQIRQRFRLKLAVHFMDDWPSYLYRGGAVAPLLRLRMERLLGKLVDAADARMAISEAMATVYSARYGRPFISVQNAVDFDAFPPSDPKSAPSNSPAHILYMGSIFDNAQTASLIDIAEAVARLSAAGRPIRFDLYSPAFLAERLRARLEIAPAVRLHDTIADDATFFRMIHDADMLVLPVNYDGDSIRLIRYSSPTKLPAYLASGTPILVYGPLSVAQVAYAQTEGWGLVVGERNPDTLSRSIERLLDDAPLRKRVAARAQEVARRNHDLAVVRQRFRDTLCAMAA